MSREKFFLITRDGKSANEFLEQHNLTKDDVVIIKKSSEMLNIKGVRRYVVLPPLPLNYQWKIRPYLVLNNLENITRYYNKQNLNF